MTHLTDGPSVKGRWIRPKTLTVYKLKLRHCTLKKKTLQNKEHIVKGECSAKNPNILWFIVDNECYILRYRWSILWSMFDKEIGCHGLILRNSKWNQKYHLLKLSWQNWIENCGDEQNLLLMKLTNVFISFFNWKKKTEFHVYDILSEESMLINRYYLVPII